MNLQLLDLQGKSHYTPMQPLGVGARVFSAQVNVIATGNGCYPEGVL